MKKTILGLHFIVFVSLLLSCQGNNNDSPNISDINIGYQTLRYDEAIFNIDSTNYIEKLTVLKSQNPLAFEVYSKNVLGIRDTNENDVFKQLLLFSKDKGMLAIRDSVNSHFPNLNNLDKEINSLLKYYKFYFPEKMTPDVLYGISEFGYGAYTYEDSLIGVGLDLFLGTDFPYDPQLFPEYIQKTMDEKHLPIHLAKSMARNLLEQPKDSRLLDKMIQNGKILYIASQLLPQFNEHTILEYSADQYQWCTDNELEIWVYLLSDNLIYSRNMQKQYKLIKPSPMGPTDMPPESPGKVGNWVGYQIIKKYVKEHPGTNIQDLIKLNDSQDVLTKAHYRPK